MIKQTLGLTLMALLGIWRPLVCQDGPKEMGKIEITKVDAVPIIIISVIVHTSDQQLFIPYCGEAEGGHKILCRQGTELQVNKSDVWQAADLRTTYGVIGASKMSKGIMITPNSKEKLFFQFERRYYKVEPGQTLRLVVNGWHDKESMDSGGQIIPLTSLPFKCPPASKL
jgi:hypothetical protein